MQELDTTNPLNRKDKVLRLSKDNLKFSAAHFLIFDEKRAERLHGHNYYVEVQIKTISKDDLNIGYGIDFGTLKSLIKKRLDLWDERVLLPALHGDMIFKTVDNTIEVIFRERRYAFPKDEVLLLPVVNTSVEQLSQLIGEGLWSDFRGIHSIEALKVRVEETRGQSAESSIGSW